MWLFRDWNIHAWFVTCKKHMFMFYECHSFQHYVHVHKPDFHSLVAINECRQGLNQVCRWIPLSAPPDKTKQNKAAKRNHIVMLMRSSNSAVILVHGHYTWLWLFIAAIVSVIHSLITHAPANYQQQLYLITITVMHFERVINNNLSFDHLCEKPHYLINNF